MKDLYLRVLVLADTFLANSKVFRLNIDYLKDVDPSAEEVAKIMNVLADILEGLAGDDPSIALNAKQCALIMESIAIAIVKGDPSELEALFSMLERHAKAPIPI